jgi:tetratricopeptide (TPR) repeat protein
MRHCKRSEAISHLSIIKKASLVACLFSFVLQTNAQSPLFNTEQQKQYQHLLNLQWEKTPVLDTSNEPGDIFLQGLGNAFDLLMNEDKSRFEAYESIFETQLDQLQKNRKQSASLLYFETELTLYWSFVYLKFGHELDAAFQLRKAYQLAAQGKKKYPHYTPLLKSHGLLQVIMGSVPEKFSWVLSIMNMEGNIQLGLKELQLASAESSEVAMEAKLVLCLVQGYVLQQTEVALQEIDHLLALHPAHQLASFIGASLALKNAQAEKALQLLNQLDNVSLPSTHYFLGEALLYKGGYEQAATEFMTYAASFQGENFIKDAYFKAGLAYYLRNEKVKAEDFFTQAKQKGNENTEADKYAARTLASNDPLNAQLFKIRFFTDGGYYDKALETIRSVAPPDLPSKKEQIEFYYRQGRLAHKTKQLTAAKLFYEQTIAMSEDTPWYFAPNACLQTGYILLEEGNMELAKIYFEKALSYKKHEYKNSIDAKAKSALAQGTKRK